MIQKNGKRKNSVVFNIDLPNEFGDTDKYFFRAGSQDPLNEEKEQERGCCKRCKCLPCFCIPCRRSRCSKCCRKKTHEPETPTLVNVEVVHEKVSCWKKMKCCKRKPKVTTSAEKPMKERQMVTITEESERSATSAATPKKRSRCALCLSKVFCCRPVNKVEEASGDLEEAKKCCFSIPCRKKKSATPIAAWRGTEQGQTITTEGLVSQLPPTGTTAASEATKDNCCSRLFQKINCCKKKTSLSESRRASMKQGTVPPPEDNRRKLHVDLVEYNSKMKGAIPVMPLYLAWFCAVCNTIVPGLGTLLSGFFCICVGIPRFTQYDSAKARLGSFIINCIVAMAQMFCVLFCFVGWGWSIWWGTIMLRTARKLNKIKKVEKLELEEEKRQAEMADAAAASVQHTIDVEAGRV